MALHCRRRTRGSTTGTHLPLGQVWPPARGWTCHGSSVAGSESRPSPRAARAPAVLRQCAHPLETAPRCCAAAGAGKRDTRHWRAASAGSAGEPEARCRSCERCGIRASMTVQLLTERHRACCYADPLYALRLQLIKCLLTCLVVRSAQWGGRAAHLRTSRGPPKAAPVVWLAATRCVGPRRPPRGRFGRWRCSARRESGSLGPPHRLYLPWRRPHRKLCLLHVGSICTRIEHSVGNSLRAASAFG